MVLFLVVIGICILTAGIGLLVVLIPQEYIVWGIHLFSIEDNNFIIVRVVFGGIPFALGIFPLLTREFVTFQMLGFTYLVCGTILFILTHNNTSRGMKTWAFLGLCLFFGGILMATPWML